MWGTSSNKIGKKRGGILSVFQKTISELEDLDNKTTAQINIQSEKIKKEEAEKAALVQEKESISRTVGKMKAVFGLDELEKESETPTPITEN